MVETDSYKASQLNAEETALYECLSLDGRDIAAYVVDGTFSFNGLQKRLQDTNDGGSTLDLAQVNLMTKALDKILHATCFIDLHMPRAITCARLQVQFCQGLQFLKAARLSDSFRKHPDVHAKRDQWFMRWREPQPEMLVNEQCPFAG